MRLFNIQNNRGFTLLFAVVISALVLSIGLSIASITLKQVQLSSSGRESQLAFYAADSGSECALYYDITKKAFPDPSYTPPVGFDAKTINCGQAQDQNDTLGSDANGTSFTVHYGTTCALVTVSKQENSNTHVIATTILSRGYNTCDDTNPRKLERGFQISY